MPKKEKRNRQPSFDEIAASLRTYKFDVAPAAGVANPGSPALQVSKYGCAAVIADSGKGQVPSTLAGPGILIQGEIGHILDKGFQKFIKTSKAEQPATAEHLKDLYRFREELKHTMHSTSLYNEGLGTVSDEYMYDRVKGRNLPLDERPRPAWELPVSK